MKRSSCTYPNASAGLLIRLALVLTFLSLGNPAQAHKVNLFAYVEGDRVVVEGYFSASAKAQDCVVVVFDQQGKKLHEGKTDREGTYSFRLSDLPAFSGGLKIVMEAGMGHKAEYTLAESDIPSSTKNTQPPKEPPKESKSEESEKAQGQKPQAAYAPGATDQAAIMATLENMLDRKLDPVVRMLGKQERLLLEERHGGPKLSEVVGGIGWIIGLAGLGAFFAGRRQ